jgi:hypothetical protein
MKVPDLCALRRYDNELCRTIQRDVRIGMTREQVQGKLREFRSEPLSIAALAYFADRDEGAPMYYLGFHHRGAATNRELTLQEVIVSWGHAEKYFPEGVSRYLLPLDRRGRDAVDFKRPKRANADEAWTGGSAPPRDKCPLWECLERFAHASMTPSRLKKLKAQHGECFEPWTTETKTALRGGDCLPLRMGEDSRNGLPVEVYFDCGHVCPADASYGIRYAGVTSADECKEAGGLAAGSRFGGAYLGCEPRIE